MSKFLKFLMTFLIIFIFMNITFLITESDNTLYAACNHVYSSATCTKPAKCTKCGQTTGAPSGHPGFSPATCTKPSECIRCGVKSGKPLGHSFIPATCTQPSKCKRCSVTQGSKLNHKFETRIAVYHNEKQHYEKYQCVCGETKLMNYKNHNFTDGKCYYCGYIKEKVETKPDDSKKPEVVVKKCSLNNVIEGHDKITEIRYDIKTNEHTKNTYCTTCNVKIKKEVQKHEFKIKVGFKYNESTHREVWKCECGKAIENNKAEHKLVNNLCECGYEYKCKHNGKTTIEKVYTNKNVHIVQTTCSKCNEIIKEKAVNHTSKLIERKSYDNDIHLSVMQCKECDKKYVLEEKHILNSKKSCNCGYIQVNEENKVENISFEKNKYEVKIGEKINLLEDVKVTPNDANANLVFEIITGKDGYIEVGKYTGKVEAKKSFEQGLKVRAMDTKTKVSAITTVIVIGDSNNNKLEEEKELPKFDDVRDDAWYKDAINNAVQNGLFNGTSENQFSPDKPITRGMFVTVLARLDDADIKDFANSFDDVKKDSYYQESISWAVANGIVKGVGNGKFDPDNQITREAMAVIIYNYIKVSHKGLLNDIKDSGKFADQSLISDWAIDAVNALKGLGIVNASANGNFKPKEVVTRADGAVALQKLYEKTKSDVVVNDKDNDSNNSQTVIKPVYSSYSPDDFSQDKLTIDKNPYTDAEWDRMEAELKARVQAAGFGTRAGVVEAALYLASLDYSVPYRGTPMNTDKNIGVYPQLGLNRTWGSSVKLSKEVKANGKTYGKNTKVINGMDCGAFVTWALVNGGVLPEGSSSYGPSKATNSFTNDTRSGLTSRMKAALGSQIRAHALADVADEIEPGDIALTYAPRNGKNTWTHVGLVVGVDKDNVYIAEENTTTYSPVRENGTITVNKLVVTRVPKTHRGNILGFIVLTDDKLYPAKNADGTENKGNMPVVWGK